MGRYLASEIIKSSSNRLQQTKVRSTFFEYCILLAALCSQGDSDRSTALNGKALRPIINEAALWIIDGTIDESPLPPYFNPIGGDYKTKKYWTNGPSDTIPRWATQGNLVEVVAGAATKTVRVAPFNGADVRAFFSIDESNKVSLLDLAVWWFRKHDFEEELDDSELLRIDLENKLLEKFGLSRSEAEQIFSVAPEDENEPIDLVSDLANPSSYLPPYRNPQNVSSGKAKSPQVFEPGDISQLISAISEMGFVFDDIQIASFVSAVRAKPFVILAGISGTGKTNLPVIAAKATSSEVLICPVKPNWTDSSELIGYTDIKGEFVPGELLRFAKQAMDKPSQAHFFVLDEMNLAHVEYYLAEVLSVMETSFKAEDGLAATVPLAPNADDAWSTVYLPSNLVLVGSLNVDESTNAISRKVLDRSFVIKFDDVDLTRFTPVQELTSISAWTSELWGARRLPLREVLTSEVLEKAEEIASILDSINKVLLPAKASFGFRLRDDVIQFVIASYQVEEFFTTRSGEKTHPLDLAIEMKILPRLEGSSRELERSINDLIDLLESCQSESLVFKSSLSSLYQMVSSYKNFGYVSYWN